MAENMQKSTEVSTPKIEDLSGADWPPCARCHHLRQHTAVHGDSGQLIAIACPGCSSGICMGVA